MLRHHRMNSMPGTPNVLKHVEERFRTRFNVFVFPGHKFICGAGWSLLALIALVGCGQTHLTALPTLSSPLLPITVEQTVLASPAQPCVGTFVAHDLDHTTSLPTAEARMFEGNGAGTAIGDLDDDGDLDVVLANHHGPNTILWNDGGLRFHAERMAHGDSRAATIVDVDGDGPLDIVFTRRAGGLNYWRNDGAGRFVLETLPNVHRPAYAINWGDLDGDGDLDLATGSYDAGLLADQGSSFLMGTGAGVFVYERRGDTFAPTRLALKSHALALALFDLNADERPDIVVGNDFGMHDQGWVRAGDGWAAAAPLAVTSHSTMSFDSGDIDNDGDFELFSTDMKPYRDDPRTLSAWMPMMTEMWSPPQRGDPQIMENVLQVRGADGRFRNEAYARGIDATGWSWSGKFGDLDNDGFLDLYVVNGMAEAELFDYLPGHELIEENQALHNDGWGRFARAPGWGLGSTRGGRGMSMADLDSDGDLDIVVNNLRAPAQLFENRLCGGSSLLVDLRWPAGKNTRALGARLTLYTSAGSFTRDVRATSGYLSGDTARVHFGIPVGATIERLDIGWPDGAVSAIERPAARMLITATR